MYSMGEIDPVRPLSIIGLNGSIGNGKFRKIVHYQPSINFLKDALCLFCVKISKPHGVFKVSERCFNAPTHGVKHFKVIRKKKDLQINL